MPTGLRRARRRLHPAGARRLRPRAGDDRQRLAGERPASASRSRRRRGRAGARGDGPRCARVGADLGRGTGSRFYRLGATRADRERSRGAQPREHRVDDEVAIDQRLPQLGGDGVRHPLDVLRDGGGLAVPMTTVETTGCRSGKWRAALGSSTPNSAHTPASVRARSRMSAGAPRSCSGRRRRDRWSRAAPS